MAPSRHQQAPPFSKDEKVLCFHMDMLYEAKIMDVQPGNKPGDGHRFKVHYKGWKNTWDDWVLADRIRPFDDEHKELAAQLHAQLKHSMQKNAKQPRKNPRNGGESARGSEERGSSAAQGPRGRRGKDWELEQVGGFVFFPSVSPSRFSVWFFLLSLPLFLSAPLPKSASAMAFANEPLCLK
ncbi:histone acetylase complex subunit MRG15-2 [Ophiocordyceps camponoti-floridani]|uniref:Chromatin modification-related protein EAF3 n=1 Tax=Ophiocordyceps camponoti-floridani TaxID=2030778 RepID=A0A8H4VC40_9HYPO|nr:histone acetylase complex subunit MRG15-2 [Ophiocordyceps camponoti-floridani]